MAEPPAARPLPSLEAFEIAAARRDLEDALNEAFRILKMVDDRYGRLDLIGGPAADTPDRVRRIATRFGAAFGPLVCDPATPINDAAFEHLIAHHRWIELMFSASGFGSSDHLVPLLATGEGPHRRVPPEHLARFLLIFSAAAGMKVNLDESLRTNPAATVGAALAYLGSRFCFTDTAHALREELLAWLPDRLAAVKLGELALQHLASPYMHCSYAMSPAKHAVKAPMIAQMRRGLLDAGCPEYDPAAPPPRDGRPTIMVTAENFSHRHSIWRTHSLAVKALRRRFRVVGLLYPAHVSPQIEECFDEIVLYDGAGFFDVVGKAAREVLARRPAMVLHLGVGLSPFVIALASLRLAPVQAASFGHTATTASPLIDAMILPDDFAPHPTRFTERLVTLPAAAVPYRLREDIDFAAVRAAAAARSGGGQVRIAVPASTMKLGPPLFDALARASAAARSPLRFHVLPLGASDLGHAELTRRLADRLPNAVVHPELPYDDYIARLATCDFFVCPFPYGNMNSIVDAALVGLPGVCLDGPEAHAHADVGYFRRLGFPDELATQSVDDYVTQVVRLADDRGWRAHCRAIAAKVGAGHAFFADDADLFVEAIRQLISGAA